MTDPIKLSLSSAIGTLVALVFVIKNFTEINLNDAARFIEREDIKLIDDYCVDIINFGFFRQTDLLQSSHSLI